MAAGAAVTVAARLDRLPPSRHVRRLITLLSLGGWFEFYDLFFTAYVAVGLFTEGLFSPTTQGLFDLHGIASFVAAMFAGMFIGTLVFSRLSDRFGRRSIFTFALLWYSVGAFVMAFQKTPETIDLWRFIASIGLGVELVNIDAYLSELVPKEQRGSAFAYNQFIMYTSVPIAAFLAWQLVPHTILGLAGWRWVVIIGSIGAVVIWWIRRHLPESPRWLAQHGRVAEAESVVAEFERRIQAETGVALPPPQTVEGEGEHKAGAWMEMWSPAYRGRTIMLVIFNLFQTIGYYGFSSWVPALLISQGIGITKSLAYTFIIAIAAPDRPADRRLLRRSFRTQMAARMGGHRHRGVRAVVRATDHRCRRDRVRASDHVVRQLDVVFFPRLPGRALSNPHSRPGGWLRLFVEPVQRHLLRLRHRLLPRPLRHGRRVQLHRRRHGRGLHRHRRLRPARHQAPARGHRGVTSSKKKAPRISGAPRYALRFVA